MTRRFLTGLLLAALGWLLFPAAPAQAHAVLLASDPVTGAVLAQAPERVTLTFNEPVAPVAGKIRVVGPDGKRVDRGDPVVFGEIMTLTLSEDLANGTYLVSYRVISADSHAVPGGFTFSIGAPSASPPELPDEDVPAAVSWGIGIAKFLGYTGLALLAGAVLVLARLWPSRLPRRSPARVLWAGLGLTGLAGLASLYLQAAYTTGTGLSEVTSSDLGEVLGSRYGIVVLIRIGLLLAAVPVLGTLLGIGPRIGAWRLSPSAERGVLFGGGSLLALTWPLTGHPVASPVPAVSVVVDALHLGAAATWLGGLAMLALFLLRRADRAELRGILPVWSWWAGVAITTVLLAGLISALIEVGTFDALVSTTFGKLIMIKAGLVALLAGAALIARRLTQRDAADRPAPLRRVVGAELAIAAVVLAVTAVLTQAIPARTAVNTQQGQQYYSATVSTSLYTLQVEVDPARIGNNLVHLYAYTPQGQPLRVAEWGLTAALPSAGVEPIEVPILPITDNHVTGSASLPTPGNWELRVTVRVSEIDQASVTAVVPIE